MIFFPNSKINLGLNITEKRPDGFHNIETVFYPVGWCDALEVIENRGGKEPFVYSASGLSVQGDLQGNLIYRAWDKIRQIRDLPALKVHLHKHIPMGAGLGGGSSDAAAFIQMADEKFSLGLSDDSKYGIASSLGSDCAFFLKNKPLLASGKGDQFQEVGCDLSGYFILIVYPGVHSDTRLAYSRVQPKMPETGPGKIVSEIPVSEWKNVLVNDFESSVFSVYPVIEQLKRSMYDYGALYSSMSGSGSAVFGIFDGAPDLAVAQTFPWWLEKPAANIL